MQWLPPELEHMGGETREGGIQYFTALRGGEGRRENVENPCNTWGPLLNIAKAAGKTN